MTVEDLAALTPDLWDAALEAAGTPYRFSHRSAAGIAFEGTYDEYRFEPYRVTYRDGTVLLVPLVRVARRHPSLTMLLGMPLGLEGTPLVLAGAPAAEHMHALFDALPDCGHLALHGGAGGSPPATGTAPDLATHILELSPGFESLWEGSFSSKNRNSCRKAERAGVRVERSTDAGAYHDLYATASLAWGYDEPPYPRGLVERLVDSGHAELWLGRLDDRPIAGALLLQGSGDLLYWSGAVDAEHRTLAPGNAVIKTAIESACERGVGYFDFGASTGLPGVSAFKESFGAREVVYRNVGLSSRAHRAATAVQRGLAKVGRGS